VPAPPGGTANRKWPISCPHNFSRLWQRWPGRRAVLGPCQEIWWLGVLPSGNNVPASKKYWWLANRWKLMSVLLSQEGRRRLWLKTSRQTRGLGSSWQPFAESEAAGLNGPGLDRRLGTAAPPPPQQATGLQQEMCRRYNDGRCKQRHCRYRHACSGCYESHTLLEYPQRYRPGRDRSPHKPVFRGAPGQNLRNTTHTPKERLAPMSATLATGNCASIHP